MWRRGPDGAGTLCNACGVKWKQGKILQGPNASRTAEGDANNAASSSKSRKYSLSAVPSAKSKKKSGRSLSMSEGAGALTYIGNDDGREKVSETSGGGFTNSGSQRIGLGKRASTKKAITSTVLGEFAASPDAESPDNVTSPLRSPSVIPPSGLPTPQVTVVPTTLIPTSSRTTSITSQGIGVGGYPINLKLNSILFGTGGGSTYFSQPNCSAEVFENYLKVKLTKDGYEKTE
ncbi:25367_t:CDS:2, partial [Dentiscutata erythropus]